MLIEVAIDEGAIWCKSTLMKRICNEKIEDLKKKLRQAQRNQTRSSYDVSSNDEGEDSYREFSETPPSESYSYEEEHSHKRRRKSSSRRGVGTKDMKKALNQISKSPFTRGIEKAKLSGRFHQPTFSMYNGCTDPVEHVSQFKQKMTVYS